MTSAQPGDARELVGQQLGPYQIEEPLAIGGQADLFRARDLYTDQLVALKLLPATLSTTRDSVAHLRDEMRRVARLRHPHLLPVVEVATERGLLYAIAMLPSASLRDRLDQYGLLRPSEAVRFAAELAWALHALHSVGLVHGDVQPANMLFDQQDILRLADFGIVRAAQRQRGKGRHPAVPSRPLASRSYMAPELTQASEITTRSDIYSLGAVFYEMLIGTLPLVAPDAIAGDEDITTAPLPPSMRSSEDWPELAAVALKALAPDPARRYADARAFAVALRTAVFTQQREDQRPSLIAALSGVFHAPGERDESAFFQRITGAPAPSAPMPGAGARHAGPLDERHINYRAAPPAPSSAPSPAPEPAAPLSEDEIETTLLNERLSASSAGSTSSPVPTSAPAPWDDDDNNVEDDVATIQLDRDDIARETTLALPPLAGMPLPPPSLPPRNEPPSPYDAGEVDVAAAWLATLAGTADPPPMPHTPDMPNGPLGTEHAASVADEAGQSDDAPALVPPDELVEDLRRLADGQATPPAGTRNKRSNPSWIKALLAALGVTVLGVASGLGILSTTHMPNAAPGGPAIPTATLAPDPTTEIATPAATLPAARPGDAHGSHFAFPTPTPIRTPRTGKP